MRSHKGRKRLFAQHCQQLGFDSLGVSGPALVDHRHGGGEQFAVVTACAKFFDLRGKLVRNSGQVRNLSLDLTKLVDGGEVVGARENRCHGRSPIKSGLIGFMRLRLAAA